MLPQLTLILGGAASGKSAFAERLCLQMAMPCIYVATAQARDGEMSAKISAHQARRGAEWHTIEALLDLGSALNNVAPGKVVLRDCATMWLSNQMEGGDWRSATEQLTNALEACASPVVMVSNELGLGIVPENALARAFRQAHGEMNQRLATQAGLVVNVIGGLPMVLKGALPKGAA